MLLSPSPRPDSSRLIPRALAGLRRAFLVLGVLLLGAIPVAAAPGSPSLLAAPGAAGAVPLVAAGAATPVYAAANDWPGVLRAAGDLQLDIERVTGRKPEFRTAAPASAPAAVLIGTVGKSSLIDGLVAAGKINVDAIRGKWEAFVIETVENPLPGVARALVIAGSDKRGTIYGIYEISGQIGVSPWYWWADVPVTQRTELHLAAGRTVVDSPVVQYRGIFINDEAPALTGWVHEKFGRFDHTFYRHVFELLLRLRANYLWPAMWQPRAFNDEDPENPRLADEYGIVMGTSHHEPLMRAHAEWAKYGQGEWDYAKNDAVLRDFWRTSFARTKDYENIQSLGMRGDGDHAMSAETNTALLERIVADQRRILAEVSGRPLPEVPQLWALYKEVQGYYEAGLRVPDDVILLWCDDNWGNIRRLPTPEERKRAGGAGVYYHFDYVGGPRNYKWLNVTPLTKIWEQMNLAWQTGANRIWIVNVGDLKPMEFPIEYFLRLAWNPAQWPYERIGEYSRLWATREFGAAHAAEIADLVNAYTKFNRRRTPEMLAPDTLSLVHHREAERVVADWRDLVARAEKVDAALPAAARDAFFQLVLYPIKASAGVQELHVAAGLNRLYVRQGRAAANTQAARVRALFAADRGLAEQYHRLGGGKWNHQMDQIKLGYTYWQQPDIEAAPAVQDVLPSTGAAMGVAIEGSEVAWPSYGARPAVLPGLDAFERRPRWIEVFNRGATKFNYRATADQPWIRITPSSGEVTEQVRLEIDADWDAVPAGGGNATVTVTGAGGRTVIRLPVTKPAAPLPAGFSGFVATNGYVAIDAPHFQRQVTRPGVEWRTLADFGNTLGGVTAFPVTAPPIVPGGDSPRLEYDVYLPAAGEVNVELHCAPSLDFQSGEGLRLAVSLDDAPPQIIKLDTWQTLQTWEKSVGDNLRRVSAKLAVSTPGVHTLKFWLVTPGVVLERILLDAGGLKPSYLGPPESPRAGGAVR